MGSKQQNRERRLLVVDDDPDFLKIITKALEWQGYEVETAANGKEAIELLNIWSPHLVLLDVNMPGLNGLETLKYVRQRRDYVSTIFVSAKSDSEDVVRGLDAGADDYICKPFHPDQLLARVRTQLRIKDIRDQLRRANAKLKELVEIDDLTGLYNMRSVYKRLGFELQRAARYDRCVCAIMMDMDHFKSVNDSNDHLFGSFVLKEVGSIISKNVRKVDFAARYGGDEFLIVLTEIDLAGAKAFTERLRSAIESYSFDNGEFKMKLTSSIGFAITFPGCHQIDAKTLVRHADNALYEAKENGRNRVAFHDFASDPKYAEGDKMPPGWKRRDVG